MNLSALTTPSNISSLTEWSSMRSPRDSDSINKHWKVLNNVIKVTNLTAHNVTLLANDMKRIQPRKTLGFDLYPFKVYVLPDIYRGPDPDNWHTVRVRGGYVFTSTVATSSYVTGSDGMHGYAYANSYGSGTVGDILLPTGSNQNPIWFWIENSGGTNWSVRYNNNPSVSSVGNPNPWTSFPSADSNHIPIALIDAYTSSSQYQTLCRQFVTDDIISSGGGSSQWYAFDVSASYSIGSIVWVDPNGYYPIPFSASVTASVPPPLCPGAFMVSNPVPACTTGSRASGSYYYPIYPLWTSASVWTVSGSVVNQIFYEPISPMLIMYPCINNVATPVWVCGVMQGASYQYLLAYTGSH
jgi:hypothetical protein